MMWNVPHEDRHVNFRTTLSGFAETRHDLGYRDVCPICKERMDDPAIICISKQVGVPNRVLHAECFDPDEPDITWRRMFRDWNEASAYRDWFVD